MNQIPPPVLEYYLDEKLTKRLAVNVTGGAMIDWGESTPGVKKERTIYVKNLTHDRIILRQPYTEDDDLQIVDYPPKLLGKESGKVKLEFTPGATRIKPLSADFEFELVIG